MEILTVAIQKGGTGKTTTALALSQAAAVKGMKVLAIDLDPQGNFTFAMGASGNSFTSYDLLTQDAPGEPVKISPFISVYPAAWELANLKSDKGSARRLQTKLESIKNNYDLIVIDTPPTAGELQYNALQASTGLVIPLQADIYNLQSLYQIAETAKAIKESNQDLSIKGFIITKLDTRSTIARQMQEQIIVTANKNNIPYLGSIRTGIAVQESAALQKSLFEYAPNSKPAQDYMALLEQLI